MCFCDIYIVSGEPAREPVVSPKSGNVFEKSLLISYIDQNGTDPISGEDLSKDEIVEIKTTNQEAIQPKPPVYTSIPSLLSSLQTEWDSMALETFSLKQQLLKTRQELSSALYHHDAAVRVVARLTKERDEAREALNKLSASLGMANGGNGNNNVPSDQPMEIEQQEDGNPVPVDFINRVTQTQEELSSVRKGRKVPDSWASKDEISAFSENFKTKQLFSSVSDMSITEQTAGDNLILSGGGKSQAGVYTIQEQKLLETVHASGIVTFTLWIEVDGDNKKFAVGTKNGSIDVFDLSSFEKLGSLSNAHANSAICGLSQLPIGDDIIISVGKDNSWSLHDIKNFNTIYSSHIDDSNVVTCSALHPDGQYLGLGTNEGSILIIDLTKGSTVETLTPTSAVGSINAMEFSEDGRSLACAGTDITNQVQIWNLARPKEEPKILQFGSLKANSIISDVAFDYSGKFLAGCSTSGGIEVGWYDKKSKSWVSSIFHSTASCVSVGWGKEAKTLVGISSKGSIHVFNNQ